MIKSVLIALAASLPLAAQEVPRDVPGRYLEDFEKREVLDVVYDGWEPVRSPAHPAFNEIRLEDDPSGARSGRHYVRLHTLGGHTAFRMLPWRGWEIDPIRSYRFGAWLRLNGTRANAASVTLTWMDAQLRPLAEDRSTPVARARDWTEIAIDVPRVPPEARRVGVALRLEGRDVRGSCDFDRLELTSQPRLEVVPPGRRIPVFESTEAPRLQVTAPGLPAGEHRLEAVTRTPEGRAVSRRGPVAIHPAKPVLLDFPPHAPGFYEVHLTLSRGDEIAARRVSPLAVPNPSSAAGALFGATFNPFTTDYPGATDLMRLGGFRHARATLWDRPSAGRRRGPDPARILALLRDIGDAEPASIVGLLAAPPEGVSEEADRETLEFGPLALLGEDPRVWGPAFRDAVRNYREHVTHWQLGGEAYAAAAFRPGAQAALRTAREALGELSRAARLGVPVGAPGPVPPGADFTAALLPPATPGAEAAGAEFFGAMDLPGGTRLSQAAALLKRLVSQAAEGPRAAAVFLPVDSSPLGGMLDADGYPLAPLLAVRAANEILSGAAVRKDLRLFEAPVRGFVFERDGRLSAAVWCEEGEVEMDLALGPAAEVFPPLGEARRQRPGERLRIGEVPLFLRDIDLAAVTTQLSLGFFGSAESTEKDVRIPLQLDPVRKALKFRNAFAGEGPLTDVRVKIEDLPAGWGIHPASAAAASLEPSQEFSQEFLVTIPRDAAEGPGEVALALSFARDGKPWSIRLRRTLAVVPSFGIEAEAAAVAGAPDARRVSIRVTNRGDRPALLTARIRLPGLPERMEPMALAEGGLRKLEYLIPDLGRFDASRRNAEVICEERGGTRLHARKVIPLR